jgi:hypothetical protein
MPWATIDIQVSLIRLPYLVPSVHGFHLLRVEFVVAIGTDNLAFPLAARILAVVVDFLALAAFIGLDSSRHYRLPDANATIATQKKNIAYRAAATSAQLARAPRTALPTSVNRRNMIATIIQKVLIRSTPA